jgi:hypothetical protein
MSLPDNIQGDAIFSEDRRYRYALSRTWNKNLPAVMFVGLNPSTADETVNDPTVRRCINFAERWGYGKLYMMNLFAFRATDPLEIKSADAPIGPLNDHYLDLAWVRSGLHIAAWGVHGDHGGRERDFAMKTRKFAPVSLKCLKVTKDGHPSHPLYIKGDTLPIPWSYGG